MELVVPTDPAARTDRRGRGQIFGAAVSVSRGPDKLFANMKLLEENKPLESSRKDLICSLQNFHDLSSTVNVLFKWMHDVSEVKLYMFDRDAGKFYGFREFAKLKDGLCERALNGKRPITQKEIEILSWGMGVLQKESSAYLFNMIPGDERVFELQKRVSESQKDVLIVPLLTQNTEFGHGNESIIGAYIAEGNNILSTEENTINKTFLASAEVSRILATKLVSATDSLTGFAGRSKFMGELSRHINASKDSEEPFSLIMLDIDHFKNVNDKYGHPAGDLVLKYIAHKISEVLWDGEAEAFRYGGEEFAVLAKVDSETAHIIAEKIRKAVEESEVWVTCNDGAKRAVKVTCSAGVCEGTKFKGKIEKVSEEILHGADGALYKAKERGRNRVV